MAKKIDKTIMPGVVLRKGSRDVSVRFATMIRGKRFTKTCDLPLSVLIDPVTKQPTGTLKTEYNMWVESCARQAGMISGFSAMRIPSVDELVQVYEVMARERSVNPNYRRPSARTIDTAVKNYRYCAETLGIGGNRPYTELTSPDTVRRIFDSLCKRVKGISAWSYIMSLKVVTAGWTIPQYRDRGFMVERVVLPDVGNVKRAPEYQELSPEMKEKIETWYAGLANNPDRRLFLAASIVMQLAVRPCDVALLTAENFRRDLRDREHVHLKYTPKKTRESSNRRVDWPILPALWELIVEVGGDRLKEGKTLLEAPRSVFDRLNKSMRDACGMKDWNKAVYELRKLCVDTVRREMGVEKAVALSGDRRETIDRYYSDPYKFNDITPLAIMPMK